MMKRKIYIATICDDFKAAAAEYGCGIELDQFCMAANMYGEERRRTDMEIRSISDGISPAGVILHAPFNELFPAAIDPGARELAMRRYSDAADIAAELNAVKMVVHSGYMPHVYFKDWHKERSVEFWNLFMEDRELDIVIENVLEDEPYMMAEMMEKMGNDRIRLCLDTGHALCMSSVPVKEWVKVLSPYIGHLHIHNNDGVWDHHCALDDGILDMAEVLDEAFSVCSEDMTVTVEARDCRSSLKWLCEKGYI